MAVSSKKSSSSDSLATISNVVLAAFIVLALYFGRELLVPLALAALLTFMLAPAVTRLQRYIGRIGAVLLVVAMIFGATVGAGWVLTRETVQLANKLPDYKENIRAKLRSIRVPSGGPLAKVSQTWEELKKDLPGEDEADAKGSASPASDGKPMPVEVVNGPDKRLELVQLVLGPLGTASLVLLLLIFMLLQREDLRNRVIRLVGQGRIGATTRAMDDAATRVSRYLRMQLVVNVTYGIAVAIGLYFIGVPNAALWGALATVLRFVPYVGPWIAASFPIIISLAVSTDWMSPMLTIGLFVVIEVISNNVMEPWLYGSSTGVSPIALIVAALVWTWLWGPVGLVLATPLTVCMVVMGRHIPRLKFLSIALSDDEPLTPAEECYHRLQRVGEHDESDLVDHYLKSNTTEALFDNMLIPVITAAETDYRLGLLDDEQLEFVEQGLRDLLDDLEARLEPAAPVANDELPRVCCVPAKSYRDQLAGEMLVLSLAGMGCVARNGSATRVSGECVGWVRDAAPDLVCISVVAPTTVLQARYLCAKLRHHFPSMTIAVGLWRDKEENPESMKSLKEAGADAVLTTIDTARGWITGSDREKA